ncbi:MAG TPA: metallophosphoesterase [Gaiellaceae bacterium]|nr:metallophosphoesterase [Gaiellaceae bacterium]
MTTRIVHVSDLHMGRREDPEVEAALAALVSRVSPELVVASGDLTHRGRPDEHERAHRFLLSLGPPVLAVPGNHDLPYTFPSRLTSPWREFERLWGTTEPTHASPALHVVGVNSARPWRHQSGGLGDDRLRGAIDRLREAADGACRVVVLHHHLLGAPWRAARKRPLAHRDRVLRTLAGAGAELILGGHIHQATLGERREFEVLGGDAAATVLAVAPGFGQPRPGRAGEARGFAVYEVGERTLTADVHVWSGAGFERTARRIFPRGSGGLAP